MTSSYIYILYIYIWCLKQFRLGYLNRSASVFFYRLRYCVIRVVLPQDIATYTLKSSSIPQRLSIANLSCMPFIFGNKVYSAFYLVTLFKLSDKKALQSHTWPCCPFTLPKKNSYLLYPNYDMIMTLGTSYCFLSLSLLPHIVITITV